MMISLEVRHNYFAIETIIMHRAWWHKAFANISQTTARLSPNRRLETAATRTAIFVVGISLSCKWLITMQYLQQLVCKHLDVHCSMRVRWRLTRGNDDIRDNQLALWRSNDSMHTPLRMVRSDTELNLHDNIWNWIEKKIKKLFLPFDFVSISTFFFSIKPDGANLKLYKKC